MGWASEQMIEEHNTNMLDEAYAENYFRQSAEEEAYLMAEEIESEKFIDWFDDRRIDHRGYEEFDEAVFNQNLDLEDYPF